MFLLMHNGEGCPLAKGSGMVVWCAAFNAQWWGQGAVVFWNRIVYARAA